MICKLACFPKERLFHIWLLLVSKNVMHYFRYFDFQRLAEVTRTVTRNLNKIIDVNYYPSEPARKSNMRHRPIGIGVQVCLLLLSSFPILVCTFFWKVSFLCI